jgi:hypothetical protein
MVQPNLHVEVPKHLPTIETSLKRFVLFSSSHSLIFFSQTIRVSPALPPPGPPSDALLFLHPSNVRRTKSPHRRFIGTGATKDNELPHALPQRLCELARCPALKRMLAHWPAHHACPRTSRSPNASDGSGFSPNFVPFKNHILKMILRKLYFQF